MEKLRKGGVCVAKGFTAGGIHAGIKKDPAKKDLAIIYCEKKCNAAAIYTNNKVKAAPITVTKKHLFDNQAQAIIVNSGNANACTANGTEVAEKMCELTAKALGIAKEDVIVASTGVIGQELNTGPLEKAIPELSENLSKAGTDDAGEAIMTTDTYMKTCSSKFELTCGTKCRIGGIAKGSGMINPDMGPQATMLAFITTDVNITPKMLKQALCEVNEKTFNMICVDGDTSTNDMVCILASGMSGNREINTDSYDYIWFVDALYTVMVHLAIEIAQDGEGATKLLECVVKGAPDKHTAKSVAKTVISSSLVKAALGAADANWGRILCAIGYSEGEFDINKVEVAISSVKGNVIVCKDGRGVAFSEKQATEILSEKEVDIFINLNSGTQSAVAWGCDLTEEYIRINADYRS